ncbi:MAG: hypothetical protein A3B95_01870 [Candidatus Doudnabacteria bacterium RIFCSPHIGHO2_02_FULL_43_13b]|nr:MAG: hypothetical protein A3B95_01870 [Candidatus Doudnabacteria bacterium RIFCSPHIGHO2_02_FULL_43_13b]
MNFKLLILNFDSNSNIIILKIHSKFLIQNWKLFFCLNLLCFDFQNLPPLVVAAVLANLMRHGRKAAILTN